MYRLPVVIHQNDISMIEMKPTIVWLHKTVLIKSSLLLNRAIFLQLYQFLSFCISVASEIGFYLCITASYLLAAIFIASLYVHGVLPTYGK